MAVPSFVPSLPDGAAVGPVCVNVDPATIGSESPGRWDAAIITAEFDRFSALCLVVWALYEDDEAPVPVRGLRLERWGSGREYHNEDGWPVAGDDFTDTDAGEALTEIGPFPGDPGDVLMALRSVLPRVARRIGAVPYDPSVFEDEYRAFVDSWANEVFGGLEPPNFEATSPS